MTNNKITCVGIITGRTKGIVIISFYRPYARGGCNAYVIPVTRESFWRCVHAMRRLGDNQYVTTIRDTCNWQI